MNDNELKKALVCCLIGECEGCPISEFSDCYETLKDEAMSLINRQQAEIERLNGNLFTISNACMQRRNEAIKEFAERLKAKFYTWQDKNGNWIKYIPLGDIDNLLTEMVGERNA